MQCGLFGAAPYQGVDCCGAEAGGGIATDVHTYHNIAQGYVLFVFVLAVYVYYLVEYRCGIAYVVGCKLGILYGDADDYVGTHLACQVCRVVVAQAAVYEHFVTHTYGRENPRYGHRSTHGANQVSAAEVYLGVGHNVCCHACKAYRQAVEAYTVQIACTELPEQTVEVAPAYQASLLGTAAAEAAYQGIGVLLMSLC